MLIVGLGDSITAGKPGFLSPLEDPPAGSGDIRSQYAYWMVRRHPDWRVLNRGVSGERIDEVLERLRRDALDEKPDCLIVLAGANDLHQSVPVERMTANLEQIYTRARNARIRVLACTVMPYAGMGNKGFARMVELNRWIARFSAAQGLGCCDLHAALREKDRPLELAHSDDGVHPDVEGYRLMADVLCEAILQMPSDVSRIVPSSGRE